jgi:hypothetical protein
LSLRYPAEQEVERGFAGPAAAEQVSIVVLKSFMVVREVAMA